MMTKLAVAVAALVATQAQASDTWRKAESPHFIIYSRESAASLKAFAEKLELFDAALRFLFPLPARDEPTADRLAIYVLDDPEAVQRVMGRGSGNVYGVYRPLIAGSIALTARHAGSSFDPDTQIVLFHEYAHHFMLRNFPAAYPTWFVEGFAEFVSTARFEKGGIGIGTPATHRTRELGSVWQISLDRLLADDLSHVPADQRVLLYGRGWLLTHMLMFDGKRQGQLTRYLREINSGAPTAQSATIAFGDNRKLTSDLGAYLARPQMTYYLINQAALKPLPISVEDLGQAESAIIPMRIESKFGVDAAKAKRLVPIARKAAAPYPNDPAAQCMLAEAEDDAGNFAEADVATDHLLETDARSYCGLLYKGEVAMHRAKWLKAATDDKAWSNARSWLIKANRVEIEKPLPMFLYYQTYRMADAKPSKNAIDALIGAATRTPQDKDARTLATIELLNRHKTDEARNMLGPVANSAHSEAGLLLVESYHRIGTDSDEVIAKQLANQLAKSESGTPAPASH